MLHHLSNRSVVRVSGPDAQKLLNDTLTCRFDPAALAGVGRWFALLSPQGKVLVEGLVTFNNDAWWFDLESGLVVDFVRRMKLYRLRAKADIEPQANLAVFWSETLPDDQPTGALSYRDERVASLGSRLLLPAGSVEAPDDSTAYHTVRIAAGVPELGADFIANDVFAHDIGLDILNGIDFIKGCYIGQEVVSRMKHRGTARRRPVIISGITTPGVALLVGERESGSVGLTLGGNAVGIVRLDRITDDLPHTVGGERVRLTLPSWATYSFGETGAGED